MSVEFDHLFVCVSAGAPEAECLLAVGFREGQSNVHAGQGTSCRRFFFQNAYLELLWIHDETEARSELVEPTKLWERWLYQQTGYCPFGIGLRPEPLEAPRVTLPFGTWAYRPAYLPPSLHIDVADNGDRPVEPLLFCIPAGRRPDRYPAGRRQPLEHSCGAREMTEIRITLPLDRAPVALERLDAVSFMAGREHKAEISFDGEETGAVLDCRPSMPLVLRW